MLELLPHYSRLAATLNKSMPEFGPRLVSLLEEEFRYLNKKKKKMDIESKIKNVRFIAELTKFKVFPFAKSFKVLSACVADFRQHSLEQLSHLLDACGRFLYLVPQTNPHMVKLLDIMARKKDRKKHLDMAMQHLIENAIQVCMPPEKVAQVVVERTPLEQYVRKLVLKELSKGRNPEGRAWTGLAIGVLGLNSVAKDTIATEAARRRSDPRSRLHRQSSPTRALQRR